jgi:YD repeat-containing protein
VAGWRATPYDGAGRLATTTDPLGRTDSLFYDGADRLLRQPLNSLATHLRIHWPG